MAIQLRDSPVDGTPNRASLQTIAAAAVSRFASPLVQGLVSILAIAALSLLCIWLNLDEPVSLLLYVALVVVLAFSASPYVAVGSAVVSAFAYDFVATPPKFQITLSTPFDVLALALFIGLGIIITTLASRLRERTSEVALATAKIEKQNEMMRQAQEFARLNRLMLMGEMTASIAHEINQPLTGIISNAGTSLRYLAASEPNVPAARQYLDYILRDGTRAAELIKDLRRSVRRAPAAKELVDVNQMVATTLTLTQRQLENSGTHVRLALAHDLPAVCADPVQLPQVLTNLILNANEAMDEVKDRERVIVVASGLADPDHAFIEVRDSGPGLKTGDFERIFDPFYTTKADGMGMGLAICRVIVEGHGGRLEALPNDPVGAVFRFTLPLREPAPSA